MKVAPFIYQNQSTYLNQLISKHKESSQYINSYICEVNKGYELRIVGGEYDIKTKNYSKSTSNLHSQIKQIKHYLTHREQLQSRVKMLDKNINQMARGSLLSDQQRLNFLKKIKQQQQQLNKKKIQNARASELRERQKQEEQKMIKQLQENQKRQLKRRSIEKKLQQLEEQKQRRTQQIRQRNKQYLQVARQKTLLHRIQEHFNHKQNINLQQKKKKLAQIRQIHKSMSKSQFQEHLLKIHQYKDNKQSQKKMEQQIKQQSPKSTKQFYKSHWYNNVTKQEKIDEDKFELQQREAIQQLKDKQKKYAQYIKHNYAPQTDDKLTEQIQKRIPAPIKRKKPKQIRQMGLDNLKLSKEKIVSKQELEERTAQQARKNQSIKQKPINYLQSLKKGRRSNSLNELVLQSNKNKQGSETAKLQNIKHYTQRLEKKALQREELQKVKKTTVDTELDELYMKALNAKLNLLNKK